MIEKLHQAYLEFMRTQSHGNQPSAFLVRPELWYQAVSEAYQTANSAVAGNLGEKKNKFRGIPVYRSMDLEPDEIKVFA